MESNLNEFDQEPVLRPTLLTVLCILTFIGSGLTLINGVWSYTSASRSSKMFSSAGINNKHGHTLQNDSVGGKGVQHREGVDEKIMLSVSKMMSEDNIRKTGIGAIFSGLCTLTGALLMWRLRRKGFYLYILGILIGILVPFYLYGNNLIAVGVSSFSSFFGLVFIALYALNIKILR